MSAEERVRKCDGDGQACPRKGKQVVEIKIEWGQSVFQADLCKEHARPLYDFMAEFPAHFTVKIPAGARRGIQIHTMDEIESMKDGPRR